MDERTILKYSRELALGYLGSLGARIAEDHGLYKVEIPKRHRHIFGGTLKRVTFSSEVASLHSCELAVPGSNFLDIVLREIRKRAPVTAARIKKRAGGPEAAVDALPAGNCAASLVDAEAAVWTAVRFHFNVTTSSTKRVSVLERVDVDLDTGRILDIPADVEEEPAAAEIGAGDPRLERAYGAATEYLHRRMAPTRSKFESLSRKDLEAEMDALDRTHRRREEEIRQEVKQKKARMGEYAKKISGARTYETGRRYRAEMNEYRERMERKEAEAGKKIHLLDADRKKQEEQIRKKYRPAMEMALVAATVYSYPGATCTLEFRNGSASRRAKAVFSDPAGSFAVRCEACGKTAEGVYLCTNSHVSCGPCSDECADCKRVACVRCRAVLNTCYICRQTVCRTCASRCGFCSDVSCGDHSFACGHCSRTACFFCSDGCHICSKRFCEESMRWCTLCGMRACSSDSDGCSECGNVFCRSDIESCAVCARAHCADDAAECRVCGQVYGAGCVEDSRCATCRALRQAGASDPAVQRVIEANAELAGYKKWKRAENRRFVVLRAKKMIKNRLVVYDKEEGRVVVNRGGWF